MNDWLDYKGSGSARACTANGLISDSNISHGLFGIPTEKEKAQIEEKQKEADMRLLNAYKEKKDKLKADLNTMRTQLKDCTNKINETSSLIRSNRAALADSERSLEKHRTQHEELKSSISKTQGEIFEVDKKISLLEASLERRSQY